MYEEVARGQVIGKTIKDVCYSYDHDKLLMTFEDNTFVMYRASVEMMHGDMEVWLDSDKINWFNTGFYDHVIADSLTATDEELDVLYKQAREEGLQNEKQERRRQYDKLKLEFEGGDK